MAHHCESCSAKETLLQQRKKQLEQIQETNEALEKENSELRSEIMQLKEGKKHSQFMKPPDGEYSEGLMSLMQSISFDVQEIKTTVKASVLKEQLPQQEAHPLSPPLPQQLPQKLVQEVAHQMAQQIPQLLQQQLPQQLSQQLARELAQKLPHELAQQLAHQLVQQLPQQLAQQLAHQLVQQLPQQLAQQLAHQLVQQLPQQLAQQLAHQLVQQLPQQLAQQLAHQLVQQLPQQLAQQLAHQLVQQLPQQLAQLLPQQSQSSTTSWKFWKCGDCDKLRKELQEKDKEIHRWKEQPQQWSQECLQQLAHQLVQELAQLPPQLRILPQAPPQWLQQPPPQQPQKQPPQQSQQLLPEQSQQSPPELKQQPPSQQVQLTQLTTEQAQSTGILTKFWGCGECEKLKKELQKKDRERQRLYTELNAEVKKHQGDFGVSRSADEIGKEFLTFFTSEMHEVLQGIQKTQKIPAREQLCCIFQAIYSQVSSYVVSCVTEMLHGMFERQQDVGDSTANDMKRAYARLLSAANLTGKDPNTEIQREVQCIPIHCPLISQDRMQQFITKATKIAWNLVTAVPPLVPSCDECDFFEGLHEKAISWDEESSTKKMLKYIRPVLYTSSIGAVTQKGSVRNAESDGEPMDVISALTGLKDWEKLALHLGVPESKSRAIQQSRSQYPPLYEVIKYWMKTKNASWEGLAVALEQCGEDRIAHSIKRKYVKPRAPKQEA